MTFNQLAKWYLKLEKVKALKSFWLVELCLKKFNAEFGDRVVNTVKLADLENYQAKRVKIGMLSKRRDMVFADGEPFVQLPTTLEIQPKGLPLIMPV